MLLVVVGAVAQFPQPVKEHGSGQPFAGHAEAELPDFGIRDLAKHSSSDLPHRYRESPLSK